METYIQAVRESERDIPDTFLIAYQDPVSGEIFREEPDTLSGYRERVDEIMQEGWSMICP